MALRINVNSELTNLEYFFEKLGNFFGKLSYTDIDKQLAKDGSVAIISFHSLEDKIVLEAFKKWENRKIGKMVSKKPLTPSEQEIEENSASKSAKLRMFVKGLV